MSNCPFDNLPNETIFYISKSLNDKSLVSFMKTGYRFNLIFKRERNRRKKIASLSGSWRFPTLEDIDSEVSIATNQNLLFIFQASKDGKVENIVPNMRPGGIHYMKVKMLVIDKKLKVIDNLLETLTEKKYVKVPPHAPVQPEVVSQQIVSPVP